MTVGARGQPVGDDREPLGAVTLAAAGLSAAEALAFLVLGLSELAVAGPSSAGVVVSAVFFAVCAAGLGWCALGLRRRQPWSRGPLVASQLLLLAIAWTYHRPYPWWAALLAVVAATCLAILLAPSTSRVLGSRGG